MADRRLGSLAAIVAIVAGLLVVWWIDRGENQVHRVEAPAGSAVTRVEALPPIEASWIADPDERAAVTRIAALIDRGGPFAFAKDGAVFENRERRLPRRPPGYWREYTVPTPGEDDRGARRLVAGDRHELYYTRDHYQSFTALRGAIR